MNHIRSGQFAKQPGHFYDKVAFVAMNPPTDTKEPLHHALQAKLDHYYKQFGGKEYKIVNIFSVIAESKKLTKERAKNIDTNLDSSILDVANWADVIIACWSKKGEWHGRGEHVLKMLQSTKKPLMTVDVDGGYPGHFVTWRTSQLKMAPYP